MRLHFAHHHVRIRHCQRSATPVAGGARVCARALRPYAKTRTVKRQNRATPRRHGVDAHHRRAHAHARHLRFKLALKLAGVVRYIGRRTAHVKTDHFVMPGNRRRTGHANDAPSRAAQNCILALKYMRICQAARRLHEEQLDARHFACHLLDVAAKDGRQVGVHHRRVAPAHKLHHRAGFMRGADLREADLVRDALGSFFMRGIAVTMHKNDRNASFPTSVLNS